MAEKIKIISGRNRFELSKDELANLIREKEREFIEGAKKHRRGLKIGTSLDCKTCRNYDRVLRRCQYESNIQVIENDVWWSICFYDEDFIGRMITAWKNPLEQYRIE